MPEVLLLKNISYEGPGLVSEILQKHGIAQRTVELGRSEPLPEMGGFAALCVFGGPQSANDHTEQMHSELAFIRAWLAQGRPYLGFCLGLQTAVKAVGGIVRCNAVPEVGFRDPAGKPYAVELTEAGKADPLLSGLPDTFPIFQLHGETVDCQGQVTCLATGRHCTNQIVRVQDKAYGLQGHLELTETLLEEWLDSVSELQGMDKNAMRQEYSLFGPKYRSNGTIIVENFLKIAGLID